MLTVVSDLCVWFMLSLIMISFLLCWPHLSCFRESSYFTWLSWECVSADMLAQEAPQPFTSQGAASSSTSHAKLGGSAPSSFWNTLCTMLLKHLYLYPEHHKNPSSVTPSTSTSDPSCYINVQVRYVGQVEDRYQFIVLHTHYFSLASVSLRFHLSLHPTASHSSSQSPTLSNPI